MVAVDGVSGISLVNEGVKSMKLDHIVENFHSRLLHDI